MTASVALKESFIKAVGVGLGFELQRLEFDISPLNLDIGQVYKETRLFLDGEEEKEWAFEPRASPWRLHSAGTTGAAGASERCSPSVSFSHRAPFDGTTIQSPRVSKAQTHSGSSPAPLVVPVPLVNSGGPPSESPSGPCRFSGVGPLSAAAWADAVAA
ncbi:hypothetical protein CB1_000885003 [Camelus ferus]|nr:hypothetical protein CB1_000885003 [Camelus ferus]